MNPAPGLGQRYTYQVTATLARTPRQGGHGAERREIAGNAVKCLGGEVFGRGPITAFVGNSARRLQQTVEPPPLGPCSDVSKRGKRDVNQTGSFGDQLLWGETEFGQCVGPEPLDEHIGAGRQREQLLPCRGVTKIQPCRQLAVSGIDHE